MTSTQKTARIAGFLYLLVAIFSGFAHFLARVNLIVPRDAAATVANITASEMQFRMGFVSDILAQVFFIFLLLALFKLLKNVNKTYAVAMVIIALVGVPIACVNLLNQYAVILLLGDGGAAFTIDQINAFVMFFLNLHDAGYGIAHVFFGLWLLPLGLLVFRSGLVPRFFGIMLMVAAPGYLIGTFVGFLFPAYAASIEPIYIQPAIAEISFCLWLLIRGVKVQNIS